MSKIKLSIIALSCAIALTACSSSSNSKGSSDQVRQPEHQLSPESPKNSESNKVPETTKKTEEDKKVVTPLSSKIFGGVSGEMKGEISGGTIDVAKNKIDRTLTDNIREFTYVDEKLGKFVLINILRRAGEPDPFDPTGETVYPDTHNLRKEGQTILSNTKFQASAFGTYLDNLSDNQYFFAQGNPTALAQIPTAGKVEYNGGAVYKKNVEKSSSEKSEMTATADFANKVIDINIKQNRDAVPEMKFGGKITGNSFAGEVNGIKTQGGFFGKNAQEMTGLFTNEADKSSGAFGGIKK